MWIAWPIVRGEAFSRLPHVAFLLDRSPSYGYFQVPRVVRGNRLPPSRYGSLLVNPCSTPPPVSRQISSIMILRSTILLFEFLPDSLSDLICIVRFHDPTTAIDPCASMYSITSRHQIYVVHFSIQRPALFLGSSSIFDVFFCVFGLFCVCEEGRDHPVHCALNSQQPQLRR